MNAVDPIKSLDDIRKMKELLAKKQRNALLFSFGINSGLRISDILALNIGDVRDKEYIEIRELIWFIWTFSNKVMVEVMEIL